MQKLALTRGNSNPVFLAELLACTREELELIYGSEAKLLFARAETHHAIDPRSVLNLLKVLVATLIKSEGEA